MPKKRKTKKKTGKKSASRRSKTTNKRGNLRRKLLFNLCAAVLIVGFIYVLWLDYQINSKFSGNRWALPARVYASPVELYVGQSIDKPLILSSLQAAGYTLAANTKQAGEYAVTGDRVNVHLRKFVYPDQAQSEQRISINIQAGLISRIMDVNTGGELAIVRLEPELIGKIYPDSYEDRVLIKYENIPEPLLEALVTIEDRHFFTHPGIDIKGILRAALANIKAMQITQGGSTLTQQLVKNYFLTQERKFWRKINEIIMALLLEQRYSKEEILEAYCNEIFLGQQGKKSIHGFGTAAEYYFARPLDELQIEQLAMLVAMVRGASYYNPRRHPERVKRRRDLVLEQMVKLGHLDADTAVSAKARPLGVTAKPRWSYSKYPAFIQLLREQLLRDYKLADLRTEGLQIHTTLDSRLQNITRVKTAGSLGRFESKSKPAEASLQSASVFVNNSSGAVLALIGSRNPDIVSFNRATEANRQIGSLIKPLIFYTALEGQKDMSLTSKVEDEDISIKQQDGSVWEPQNYDRVNHGKVSLIEALAFSYNKASVRLGHQTGTQRLIKTMRKLGVDGQLKDYDSLLLGAVNLSPLQVAQFYQAIANGGFLVPLNTITEVMDRDGNPLQRYEIKLGKPLKPQVNFLTQYLMTQAVKYGTGRGLSRYDGLQQELAGKTGTSNGLRDSWFVGFGDDISGVTWIGRDNNTSTGLTGATGAMVIWAQIMAAYGIKPINLVAPPEVQWSEEIMLKFRNDCLNLGPVPYINNIAPESDSECI